jgi:hypothetical protein
MLDQIIKGYALALHSGALLAEDITNLRMANEKIVQKRNRSTRRIPCAEGLTIEEAIQLAEQLNQPEEDDGVDSHAEVELPSQPIIPAKRVPPRCSGCREIGHRINTCKNRYI